MRPVHNPLSPQTLRRKLRRGACAPCSGLALSETDVSRSSRSPSGAFLNRLVRNAGQGRRSYTLSVRESKTVKPYSPSYDQNVAQPFDRLRAVSNVEQTPRPCRTVCFRPHRRANTSATLLENGVAVVSARLGGTCLRGARFLMASYDSTALAWAQKVSGRGSEDISGRVS